MTQSNPLKDVQALSNAVPSDDPFLMDLVRAANLVAKYKKREDPAWVQETLKQKAIAKRKEKAAKRAKLNGGQS